MLATVGSLGDLHPFIALGLALRARGAEVVLACAAEYRVKVEAAGLGFRAVRPSFDDMERLLGMDRAQLTRALLARADFLFRRLIVPSVRTSYEDMRAIVTDADMVVTSSLAFGARLAAERCAIPWIAVVLQPSMFLSAFDPPVFAGVEWLRPVLERLGPKVARPMLGLVKSAIRAMLGPVRALRREIGLPPDHRNPLFEGQYGPDGAIGLYSRVLGGIRPDYPQPTAIVGFASFDSEDGAASRLDPALSRFLGAGPPPLVFTLGSLIVHSPGSFYRESVGAARMLGHRAVLLVGEQASGAPAWAQSAADGGEDIFVCAYAPHSLLFPRAEAITHQGGIGTLAQALSSGRPHLVVPFYADQADNAARAVRLGVARSLTPARYTAASAARELRILTSAGAHRARARAVRDLVSREDGATEAAAVVLNRLESRLL